MRRICLERAESFCGALLIAALITAGAGTEAIAQDAGWHVSKSSGDVWLTVPGAQQTALESEAVLKPGDMIHTGANGRVLLERGAESILISPNSVVGIPAAKTGEAMPTTIIQQVGTILLDVEKRNVQHFEVATPYLAAVVKGTQFRVTVEGTTSRVDVLRGQVQVTDYKTGQRALVNQDQAATVMVQGKVGLSLSGSGALNPIELGVPSNPVVMPVTLPAASGSASVQTPAMQPQVQSAAPMRRVEWKQPEKDTGWGAGLLNWGKEFFNPGGRKDNDGNSTIIAIPIVVGLSVTVGALAMRRKRKAAPKPGDR